MSRLFAAKWFVANPVRCERWQLAVLLVEWGLCWALLAGCLHAQSAISSDEFLKQLSSDSVRVPQRHTYPLDPLQTERVVTTPVSAVHRESPKPIDAKPETQPVKASYLSPEGFIGSEASQGIKNESAPSWLPPTSPTSPTPPSTSIGGGINDPWWSSVAPNQPSLPAPTILEPAPTVTPEVQVSGNSHSVPEARQGWMSWPSWLTLDPSRPDFSFEMDYLSLRRSNDSGGAVSAGQGFDRLGRESAGRYTLGKLNSGLDRTEWVFMGPFEWERSKTNAGPISTILNHGTSPAMSLGPITNSDQHVQTQTISVSSFEWNRRWSSDGLSSFLGGFRFWDYDERYRLSGRQGLSVGEFATSADNVLVGTQVGMVLVRPLSQRLSVGGGTLLGLFGNFSQGEYSLMANGVSISNQSDDAFRLLWTAQPQVMATYQITQNARLSCGYEAFYFSKLATVADLRLGDVSSGTPFSLRAGDNQLLYGWTATLAVQF
jgi:hypothetical protein